MVTIVAVTAGCSDGTAPNPPASSVSTESAPIPQSATAATPAPTSGAGLAAEFQQFADMNVGVVLMPVGDTAAPAVSLGTWTDGPAWSTIKVPLSIAALRESQSTTPTADMRAAITRSDNAAAEAIWSSLGTPEEAKAKVEAVLKAAGSPTTVQSQKVRPEFTAFGQTIWSLTDQARFLSSAACDAADQPIFDLMSQVEGDQQWGLGTFENAKIKGGWGPSVEGPYLVRQIGVITTPKGETAVAIAAAPGSGSFGEGTKVLDQLAAWLKEHVDELPAGQCPGGSASTEGGSTVESPTATVDAPSPSGSIPAVSPSP